MTKCNVLTDTCVTTANNAALNKKFFFKEDTKQEQKTWQPTETSGKKGNNQQTGKCEYHSKSVWLSGKARDR